MNLNRTTQLKKPPSGATSSTTSANSLKFLCSYGGKILPRGPDGKLRYQGGHTRVLAVDRSIPFLELLLKLSDLCSPSSVLTVRCQLPTEDLDALVSIKSDEDLAHLIEEYDRFSDFNESPSLKIRAFLTIPRNRSSTHQHLPGPSSQSPSPPSSTASSPRSLLSPSSTYSPRLFQLQSGIKYGGAYSVANKCNRQGMSKTVMMKSAEKKGVGQYAYGNGGGGGGGCLYLVHDGSCQWR